MRNRTILIVTASLLGGLLSGCGGEKTKLQQEASAAPKSTELTVYKSGLNLTDTEFQTFFVEPVKKKYPEITLKLVADAAGSKPEDLLAANAFPDIIFTANPSYYKFVELKVVRTLDEWVKAANLDLNRIKPVITESIRSYTKDGSLIALPFSQNVAALFYNQDIFDKFGVDYPQQLMTWEEAIQKARQLTRHEDGVQYIGIDLTSPQNIGRGLSLPPIDPQTGKAAVHTESWIRVFQLLKQSYDIPGYIGENGKYSYGNKAFTQDRILAMLPNWLGGLIGPLQELHQSGRGFNWDIAPLPNFQEALGTGREIDIHSMMLSASTPYPEQAFRVMSLMLSDEVQAIVNRSGRISVLENPELEKQFGADLPVLQGKQIANVFKAKPRKLHPPSEYYSVAVQKLEEAAKKVALGSADINTALRDAQAAIDLEIEAIKQTKGISASK